MDRRWLAVAGGAAAVVGLAALWWEYRYAEPPQDPDLTGRVVEARRLDGYRVFGRTSWTVVVVPDPGTPPGRPVSLTIRREAPVRSPGGQAGLLAPGQRVRVWRWGGTELSDGTLVWQARFVSILPNP
jgi:hypothetical protein